MSGTSMDTSEPAARARAWSAMAMLDDSLRERRAIAPGEQQVEAALVRLFWRHPRRERRRQQACKGSFNKILSLCVYNFRDCASPKARL